MGVNLRSLIGKLNDATRNAVEASAGLCLSRTHYDVEIEHYLLKLLDSTELDAAFILKHYGVDRARLTDDLTRALDSLKSGNGRVPSLSPLLIKVLVQAWTIGSMELGAEEVRTGHTLFALVANEELRRVVFGLSKEFQKLSPEKLRAEFAAVVARSSEEGVSAPSSSGATQKSGGKTPNLDQYTVDLTERAREGKLDPVSAATSSAPGRGHSHSAAPEQSHPCRRSRCRQDRDR
jgi:type VI secretion system protein VasG